MNHATLALVTILSALPVLRSDTVPPLLAALDVDDPLLRVELIDVLLKRAAASAVPYLWHLAGTPTQPEIVRRKATEALVYFLNTPQDKLTPAKAALAHYTRLAAADLMGADGEDLRAARRHVRRGRRRDSGQLSHRLATHRCYGRPQGRRNDAGPFCGRWGWRRCDPAC